MNQYIYKNKINGKYIKTIDVYDMNLGYSNPHHYEIYDIEDADQYNFNTGWLFDSDKNILYERVCYQDEKKLIRKKKLAQILQKKLI